METVDRIVMVFSKESSAVLRRASETIDLLLEKQEAQGLTPEELWSLQTIYQLLGEAVHKTMSLETPLIMDIEVPAEPAAATGDDVVEVVHE